MGFRKLSVKNANDDVVSEELTKAGIPSIRTRQRLSADFRIYVYGMLGEWLFYRRADHWVAKPLHTVCPWSPSRVKKLIGKRTDLTCDLPQFPTEFQLYSEQALERFIKEVSRS